MKKLSLIIILGLLFVSCIDSKNQQVNFNGIWSDCNGEHFDKCYAVFSTIGDSIHMGHYIEFKGESFFESGSGIIKGDSIIYHVDVIKPIEAWGPDGGTHYLKLSKDKNTLEGIFITDSGNKGPLIFKRR
ncbi:MAG: hypothetical protein BM563_01670 [Bacteroidetes bacterium MedPE-SWsnd-G1]|nr:MAG: hypothetical protein BM563_01670 [Bacteroidetes bacterium MedPE-SWsnd-G1]